MPTATHESTVNPEHPLSPSLLEIVAEALPFSHFPEDGVHTDFRDAFVSINAGGEPLLVVALWGDEEFSRIQGTEVRQNTLELESGQVDEVAIRLFRALWHERTQGSLSHETNGEQPRVIVEVQLSHPNPWLEQVCGPRLGYDLIARCMRHYRFAAARDGCDEILVKMHVEESRPRPHREGQSD